MEERERGRHGMGSLVVARGSQEIFSVSGETYGQSDHRSL